METGFNNGSIKDGMDISSPSCSISCLDHAMQWFSRCTKSF
jgi:hypothetical protein